MHGVLCVYLGRGAIFTSDLLSVFCSVYFQPVLWLLLLILYSSDEYPHPVTAVTLVTNTGY